MSRIGNFEEEYRFLKSHYKYNSVTGAITGKRGKILISSNIQGYMMIYNGGYCISQHRAAWMLFYHTRAPLCIDHINGNKKDNRIINLRSVTKAFNNNCKHKINVDTGFVGIHLDCGFYRSRVFKKYLYFGKDLFKAVLYRIVNGLPV